MEETIQQWGLHRFLALPQYTQQEQNIPATTCGLAKSPFMLTRDSHMALYWGYLGYLQFHRAEGPKSNRAELLK